jgi:hypothetical protein
MPVLERMLLLPNHCGLRTTRTYGAPGGEHRTRTVGSTEGDAADDSSAYLIPHELGTDVRIPDYFSHI